MVKNRKQLLKSFGVIMGVSCLLAVGFTVSNGNNVEAKAETGALGVSWSDTKYKVSQDGEYAIVITAFKADDVLTNAENKNYIIGYEINGEEALIEYGKNYYESVALKTSETESVSYTAAQVFGDAYADYKLNVYEINEFDVSETYTVQPFIKEITLDGDNGYNVVAEDCGAENTIDVKTVTFDTDGGEAIVPIYVQNGATFGEMPVAVKENCEFSRWSEDLEGKTITEDVTLSVIWKEVDITSQFVWSTNNAGIWVKDSSSNFGLPFDTTSNFCYTTKYVDVSKYVGRTLQITLPKSNYGLVFADETATTVAGDTGTRRIDGWYVFPAEAYADETAKCIVANIIIPEGAKYLKTTYWKDASLVDGYVEFSAKILDGYEVSFDTKGGTEIPSQFVWYGEKVEVPANPTLDGATFQGWDTDLTQPVTGAMTVTAIYKYEEVDITSQFVWSTNNAGIWVKNADAFGLPWTTTSNFCYTTKYVDVIKYVGRTLQITLPKSNYGLVFADKTATTVDAATGTKQIDGWYVFPAEAYADETAKCIVANIIIPEGAKYLKTTYWKDASLVDGYVEFSAKILEKTI